MGKGYRQGRLGEEMKKLISEMLLREIKDPRLSGMISISDVQVTSDGSYATCYVSILHTTKVEDEINERERQVMEGFQSVKGLIRREIGRNIQLRHVPELQFKIDRSMEYGRHISEIIDNLEK